MAYATTAERTVATDIPALDVINKWSDTPISDIWSVFGWTAGTVAGWQAAKAAAATAAKATLLEGVVAVVAIVESFRLGMKLRELDMENEKAREEYFDKTRVLIQLCGMRDAGEKHFKLHPQSRLQKPGTLLGFATEAGTAGETVAKMYSAYWMKRLKDEIPKIKENYEAGEVARGMANAAGRPMYLPSLASNEKWMESAMSVDFEWLWKRYIRRRFKSVSANFASALATAETGK